MLRLFVFIYNLGSPDLKIPEPTNTPSAQSCIIRAASAGVAIPRLQSLQQKAAIYII